MNTLGGGLVVKGVTIAGEDLKIDHEMLARDVQIPCTCTDMLGERGKSRIELRGWTTYENVLADLDRPWMSYETPSKSMGSRQ